MANPTPVPLYALGAGVLRYAAIGSPEPTHAVTASKFSDSWPVEWKFVGATDSGHGFNSQTTFNPVEFAEFLLPIAYAAEGKAESVVFNMGDIIEKAWQIAFNGGSEVTTGAGATKMTVFTPPKLGEEVRRMLGWESEDGTERYIWRQCINTGQIGVTRNKGAANKALIAVDFSLEQPASGLDPWSHIGAGARA